jgi:hypothetical protein
MKQAHPPSPKETSEELAALAKHAEDPGARLWFLEWARAFRRLAAIEEAPPKNKPRSDPRAD